MPFRQSAFRVIVQQLSQLNEPLSLIPGSNPNRNMFRFRKHCASNTKVADLSSMEHALKNINTLNALYTSTCPKKWVLQNTQLHEVTPSH